MGSLVYINLREKPIAQRKYDVEFVKAGSNLKVVALGLIDCEHVWSNSEIRNL
jgi:hypothetical protein